MSLKASQYIPKPVKSNLYVLKRNGERQEVMFDKITQRIDALMDIDPTLDREYVDPVLIAQKVISGIFPGIKTTELDNLAAETAAYMSTEHPDYGILAARISISNLQKETSDDFLIVMQREVNVTKKATGEPAPMISLEVFKFMQAHSAEIAGALDYQRDFSYDYFGFKTLERGYLNKIDGRIVERIQHMWMRVACGIHYTGTIEKVLETYDLLSEKYFTHATPTLFNAGTPRPQMSSCFLLSMTDDSIKGIYETLARCAMISKYAGGIGVSISNIRATKSHIYGTNGTSNGLVPMLRVYNDTARYVDQGGGKRKGSFAMYLEPWHADVLEFLELRKNTGKEEVRARDLFYALWIPDLFMQRVKDDATWSLFCPNEAPGLQDAVGKDFQGLYEKYEATPGLPRRTLQARDLWFAILESQIETGTPYMLYKDACNLKSNQRNLGTIRSSNLCCEVVEYTSPDEVAVCNLASIALPRFVVNGTFDHRKLFEVTRVIVRNLNKIIDLNYYPIPEAERSNRRHRPIGIGVQGLADAFILLRLPFDSEGAAALNRDIFETIYYAAVTASMELAKEHGPYSSYPGSPMSKGVFQYDAWNVTPGPRWDWVSLKANVAKHGVRNSLLCAPMPTASTSQILGNNECFEPYTTNIYSRRVLAGEFTVVNKHLLKDLLSRGLWTPEIRNQIIAENGSIENIPEIPVELKELYKTVWQMSMRTLIDMAADRGPFIDQSQSLNVFMANPTLEKLTAMHFYAWQRGLKTGMYYLRTRPAADAIKFTVDQTMLRESKKTREEPLESSGEAEACRMEEGCIVCGS